MKLLAFVDAAKQKGVVAGQFAAVVRACDQALRTEGSKPIPPEHRWGDGGDLRELGFAPELERAAFCLSRAVGILAHAWEQTGRVLVPLGG